MKTSVFIAASLDGFIAREEGAIDRLPGIDESGAGEDCGYRPFFDSIDAMVMGRNFVELVRTVLIGSGIPLFGPLRHYVRPRLRESRQTDGGVVQSTFEVA